MKAGTLRHRVTIQQPVRVSDGQKAYTTTWSDVATVWAEVSPGSSYDRLATAQLGNSTSHTITIRALAGINSSMRVKFGTRYFTISGITEPLERGISQVITCNETPTTKGST